MKRRTFLIGSAGIVAGAWLLRPSATGANYSAYFSALNQHLKQQGTGIPSMLLDLDRLDLNINILKAQLGNKTLRIVAKSLPSIELIQYVMQRANTNKVMVFHQPFINALAKAIPEADLLLGKPMPVKAAEQFYSQLEKTQTHWITDGITHSLGLKTKSFNPQTQLQWLIDSPDRLKAYLALAQRLGQSLQINIELDVGLHRGGVSDNNSLAEMLSLISNNPEHLSFSGFMGYEPHVVKVPSVIASRDELFAEAMNSYQSRIDLLKNQFPQLWRDDLCLNAAGSPTYTLHQQSNLANELSVGSALVKPSDFDLDTLEKHIPAVFIATPVLKSQDGLRIPGSDKLGNAISWWDPNQRKSYFIYGGYWKAKTVSPEGLAPSNIYGRSSNQELLTASDNVDLSVNDHVFLRPTQSEHVMLQFGDLITLRNGQSQGRWPVFS